MNREIDQHNHPVTKRSAAIAFAHLALYAAAIFLPAVCRESTVSYGANFDTEAVP